MARINLIAAIDRKRVIGKDNDLAWKGVPGDMKRFKELTTGHPVVMGRKTLDSMGSKPLVNRTNIIITRQAGFALAGCIIAHSADEALAIAAKLDSEIFVIGGGEIYAEMIGKADRLYLTEIDAESDGNIFFPDYSDFTKIVSKEEMPASEKFPHPYRFLVLER